MTESLASLVWVAFGAAVGTPLRFWVSGAVGRSIGETFPWGTLVVNVTGAFAIGVLAAWAKAGHAGGGDAPWLFAGTGLLGAYTTVSSFSLQTLALARDGETRQAALNVALSLGLTLLAVAAGFALGAAIVG